MWLTDLAETSPVAHAIGALAFVCVLGMALGSVKVRGVGLGTAGVLFAGILVGHFSEPVDHHTLEFVKEFGLVLFVFTIGLQLGPGFFSAFREQGVRMNVLAAAIVILGALSAILAGWIAGFDPAAVLGIFSGASTNTPSLGAGTQALGAMPGVTPDRLTLPALAYAVTYPPAIVGIIGTLLLLKAIFRINPAHEAAEFAAKNAPHVEPLERRTLEIKNSEANGNRLDTIACLRESQATVSRIRHGDQTLAATGGTVVHLGDRISVVGTSMELDRIEAILGQRTDEDLMLGENDLTSRRIVVTARNVLGKTVGSLGLDARFGVACTRIARAGVELSAVPSLRLKYGDQIQIVGTPASLEKAAAALGNSIKELSETQFIPMFIGIVLGVALGTMPIAFPGLPQPVKLGLAGGPLIVALILGRIGHFRRQVWYMPQNTNLAFREFGIALFFASVGLTAGAKFFATVFSATGMQWVIAGVCVTLVPLLLLGIFARVVLKMNYMDLSGLIAGSMTDPPALAFASNISGSNAPAVAYATVYPLTTLLRILSAQILAVLLVR
jgi:putative transport protein